MRGEIVTEKTNTTAAQSSGAALKAGFEKWWKEFWVSSPIVGPSAEERAAAWAAWQAASVGDTHVQWLEDELMEVMRLVSKGLYGDGQPEDEITDAFRLHGIRLMVEAEAEKYEALLERWQARHSGAKG